MKNKRTLIVVALFGLVLIVCGAIIFTLLTKNISIDENNVINNQLTNIFQDNNQDNNIVEGNDKPIEDNQQIIVEPNKDGNTNSIFGYDNGIYESDYEVSPEVKELLRTQNINNDGVMAIDNISQDEYIIDDLTSHEEMEDFYSRKYLNFQSYDYSRYYVIAVTDRSLESDNKLNIWVSKYVYSDVFEENVGDYYDIKNIFLSDEISSKVRLALSNYSAGNEIHVDIPGNNDYTIYFIQPAIPTTIPVKNNNITNIIYKVDDIDYWAGINLSELFN